MAYKVFEDYTTNYSTSETNSDGAQRISLNENQDSVQLPDTSYIKDANLSRDGMDLVLETKDGTIVIEEYYASETPPNLVSPDGTMLTPDLVEAFASGGNEYANAGMSMNDASPVGAVQEISGEAIIIRTDGTQETIGIGTPVYPGDIVETDENGAVNIMFVDETTFAVSEDARLSIDEYVFDPATQSGVSNFSVLKGVFVFTSGLIGRDDPDDVTIDTPSGSIGIRGTIIAGDVDAGEITVIEGAIVLNDYAGNSITLADQYETARFDSSANTIEHIGKLEATDVASKFMSISTVAADLFSSIQDSASETGQDNKGTQAPTNNAEQAEDTQENTAEQTEEAPQNDASEVEAQEEQTPQETQEGQEAEDNTEANNDTQSEEITETAESSSKATETDTSNTNQDTSDNADATNTDTTASDSSEPATDTQEVKASATDNAQETPNEIITSSEITSTETKAGTSSTQATATNTQTADSGDAQTTPSPSPVFTLPPQTTPPFAITQNAMSVTEGAAGANVLHIQGQFTSMTNVFVTGPASNYYEVVRQDANNLIIKFKDTVTADAQNIPPLTYRASNDDATSIISQNTSVNVQNIDEAPTVTQTISNAFFQGSEGSRFEYDFSQDFSDNDGDIVEYTLVTAPSDPSISNLSFDTSTGHLQFDISGVAADTFPTFTIRAHDSAGNTVDNGYTFNILNDTTGSAFITGGNEVYAGNATSINILGANADVFADTDGTENIVNINGNNATVKTGDGADTLNVASTAVMGFQVFAGDDNDTFNLSSARGRTYGEAGNDTFVLQDPAAISNLEDLSTGVEIDGGQGHDVIEIAGSNSINFGNVDNGFIKNIEAVNADNANTNVIDLSYDSVIQMTDDDNRLRINTDTNDTVNFTNSSGNTFFNTGQHTSGGDTYDIFTDGTITLLIDTDANVTGI